MFCDDGLFPSFVEILTDSLVDFNAILLPSSSSRPTAASYCRSFVSFTAFSASLLGPTVASSSSLSISSYGGAYWTGEADTKRLSVYFLKNSLSDYSATVLL